MKANPMPGFIMIEPEEDKKMDGNIYLPEDAEKKTYYAKLLSVGSCREKKDEEMYTQLKANEGNRILYNKWASNEITIDDETFHFLRFDEVVATINDVK